MSALKEELLTIQDYLCIKESPRAYMSLYSGYINTALPPPPPPKKIIFAAGCIGLTKGRDDTEAEDRIFRIIARVFHKSLTNQIAIRLLVM